MTQLEQKQQLLYLTQRRNTLAAAVIGPSLSYLLLSLLEIQNSEIWWMSFAILTVLLVWSIFYVSLMWTTLSIFGNFDGTVAEDDDEDFAIEVKMEVHETSEPMGKYLDHDIYEWMDFNVNGQIMRATFHGAVDVNRSFTMPEYGVLLPPGLIYQFERQDIELLNTSS